jgi:hypothetical protein
MCDFWNDTFLAITPAKGWTRITPKNSNHKCFLTEKNEEYIYPLLKSTNKKGTILRWYNKEMDHTRTPKVIFSYSSAGHESSLNDYNGEYGLTRQCIGIIINSFDEGELIIKAFNDKIFSKMIKACQYSVGYITHKLFLSFKKDFYNIILT